MEIRRTIVGKNNEKVENLRMKVFAFFHILFYNK